MFLLESETGRAVVSGPEAAQLIMAAAEQDVRLTATDLRVENHAARLKGRRHA